MQANDSGIPVANLGAILADPGLLTTEELAAVLRVSKRTVASMVADRRIPYLRIAAKCLRFRLPAVLAAFEASAATTTPRRARTTSPKA